MGQILLQDKIGSLAHNAGAINLAASRLTIGGQQYNTSALTRTISTDVTLIANSLYMIYAVLVSGVPQLRISSNVNSVGPSGFTSWKLVGAFYSNGITGNIAFGSFVNIEGAPTSEWIPYTATLTNFSLGGAGAGISTMWRRDEDTELLYGSFGAGTGASMTGPVSISIPANHTMNTVSKFQDYGFSSIGSGSLHNSGAYAYNTGVTRSSDTTLSFIIKNTNSPGGNNVSTTSPETSWFSAVDNMSWTAMAPIIGWSNTPIKDL